MFYINKNLIKLYHKKQLNNVYTKDKSVVITKDAINKTFFVYNGKTLLEKEMNNFYLIGKKLGSLKNINTKKMSVYRSKKKKKSSKKK